MLRKKCDGTGQHAGFARILKEGKLKEKMQSKAKEAFSEDWKVQNGGACLSDEALFSFLARAQTFWVDIAEEVQQEMCEAPADGAGEATSQDQAGNDDADALL